MEFDPPHNFMFGEKLAVDGEWLGISASDPGNGYFIRIYDAMSGEHLRQIRQDDHKTQPSFGSAIAITEDRLLVTAEFDRTSGRFNGSAYIFDLHSGNQLTKIEPDGTSNRSVYFGASGAGANGLFLVGAPSDIGNGMYTGAVYAFDAQTGSFLYKFAPPSVVNSEQTGTEVATDGILAVTAAPVHESVHGHLGGAHVFNALDGSPVTTITPPFPELAASFGSSVGISGDHVAVADKYQEVAGVDRGAIHIFDASTGDYLRSVDTRLLQGSNILGFELAMHENVILAGSPVQEGDNQYDGIAILYDALTGAVIRELRPRTPVPAFEFATEFALDGHSAVVGTAQRNSLELSEAVYVFDVSPPFATDASTPSDMRQDLRSLSLPPFPDAFPKAGSSVRSSGCHVSAFVSNGILDPECILVFDRKNETLLAKIELDGVRGQIDAEHALNGDRLVCFSPGESGDRMHVFDLTTLEETHRFDLGFSSDSRHALSGDRLVSGTGSSATLYQIGESLIATPLRPDDDPGGVGFGQSVAIGGSWIAVGAPGHDLIGLNAGAVYLFDAEKGTQLRRILNPHGDGAIRFGGEIAIEGDSLIVLSIDMYACGPPLSAVVSVHDLESGDLIRSFCVPQETDDPRPLVVDGRCMAIPGAGDSILLIDWTIGETLARVEPQSSWDPQTFGNSFALSGRRIFVGHPEADDKRFPEEISGYVHVADASPRCTADFIHDDVLDVADLTRFLELMDDGDLDADLDGDAALDETDVMIFLDLFARGCAY